MEGESSRSKRSAILDVVRARVTRATDNEAFTKDPIPVSTSSDSLPQHIDQLPRPSIIDPTHPLHEDHDSEPDYDDEPMKHFLTPCPKREPDHSSRSGPSTEGQSTGGRDDTSQSDWEDVESWHAEEEEQEVRQDETSEDYRFMAERDISSQQANAEAFMDLHKPGDPVFVVNVHDLLTASIAAAQPECPALCVDLPVLFHLVGWRYAGRVQFLDGNCLDLIAAVAKIAQRSGKLLTVDLGTLEQYLLEGILPVLFGLGVKRGFVGEQDVAQRIEAIRYFAREYQIPDFVTNVVMEWPGTVDEAIGRANQYLDDGATVVTILRRIPSPDLPAAEFLRLINGIKGRVGVVLQMPNMGSRSCKASDMNRAKVARIGLGNQWPYHIRRAFIRCVQLLFSD